MSAFEIFVAIYMAAVPPALGYLFWGRLNRLESRMDGLESMIVSEISGIRGELGSEIGGIRSEIAELRSEMRQEITALRSDLTQVALAVGARPRSAEA
jgi:hypothetical protein